MDLTTLGLFVMLFASAIGVDTVLHPTSILLDATVTGKFENLIVDGPTLNAMLVYEVTRICSTPSVLAVPEVRATDNQGIGMALATAANMQSVAVALQTQFGYQPERMKITLLKEEGAIKLLVSGAGPGGRIETPPFQQELVLQKDESVAVLVHRAALLGMSKLDPYVTSLYLVRAHVADGDFSEAETLIKQTIAALPPSPISFDRSLFENLQGIIQLLHGNIDEADAWFHRASKSNPSDAAAMLNVGFVDMQLGKYADAVKDIQPLLVVSPPPDSTLLSTAYMIQGAALLVTGDVKGADERIATAIEINPTNSPAYALWSEIKRIEGNLAEAERLHVKSLDRAGTVANYAEVAALYFQLASHPGQPLTRNPYAVQGMIQFNQLRTR